MEGFDENEFCLFNTPELWSSNLLIRVGYFLVPAFCQG